MPLVSFPSTETSRGSEESRRLAPPVGEARFSVTLTVLAVGLLWFLVAALIPFRTVPSVPDVLKSLGQVPVLRGS